LTPEAPSESVPLRTEPYPVATESGEEEMPEEEDIIPATPASSLVHRPTNNGWTPMHLVEQRGRLDFARLLIEHGTDVTAWDNNGWSLLLRAVLNGSVGLGRSPLSTARM